MAQAASGAAQDVSLTEFLAGIKMQQYGTLLEELGYDDVTASGELCELAAPLVQKYPLPCVRMAPHLPPWTV